MSLRMKRKALELTWALAVGAVCTAIRSHFGFNIALAFCLISAFVFAVYLIWSEKRSRG